MKPLSRVLVAVLATATVGVIGAGNAAAAPWEWYTYAHSPAWQQGSSVLTSAASATLKGKVIVQDHNATASGDPKVECEASGSGTVGPEAAGSETKLAFAKCVTLSGVCGTPELVAANLPWSSELTASYQDVIRPTGEGVGYQLTCTILKIKVTDTCTGSTLSAHVEDAAGGVNGEFDGEKLNCSIGGANEGTVSGSVLIAASEGATLSLAGARQFKALTSAVAVQSVGNLTLVNKRWSLSCETTLKGNLETGGKGTITTGECAKAQITKGECGSGPIVTPGMPWHTAMHEIAPDEVSNPATAEGGGAALFDVTCKNPSGSYTDECEWAAPHVHNVEQSGNVLLEFTPSSKVSCSVSGLKEEAQWEGTLTIEHPEGVPGIMAGGGGL